MAVICACVVCVPSAAAQSPDDGSPALGKIKQADTVAIDCSACPRALAEAGKAATQELTAWSRFRIVEDPQKADLIFMFSANPYMGDYLTRKGPDKRPVKINGVIMTVIDPHTGRELWSDSRTWGSWRVGGATKDLIEELRSQMEVESRKWTVEDVFACSGAPAYQPFAFLTPDAALTKSGVGIGRIPDAPDRLRVSPPGAPDFCKRAQLMIGANDKIAGFEVVATQSETLDVADILEHADRYEFTSGKDPSSQRVYFAARSRDKRILIQFEVQGHRMILSRVTYSY
jgi:hypothetical protein